MGDRSRLVLTIALVCSGAALASAQAQKAVPPAPQAKAAPPAKPAPAPALVGATELLKLTPAGGYVDEVVAYDNQHVGYIVADSATKAELHVVPINCQKCVEDKEEVVVDLTPITLRPISIRLIGQRVFLVGATEDGNQVAALVDLVQGASKPIYKLGPAAHITIITRDNAQRVAIHRTSATATGTRHEIEVLALDTGKRVAKSKPFDLVKDENKKLGFRVNHWDEGYTRAIGYKDGEWVKKENQRAPDSEATFDLLSGKLVDIKPIANVVEQRKRYQTLADTGASDFVKMAWDHSAVNIWHRGAPRAAVLDQPLENYDPTSLQGVVAADGSAWIALKVDPVNPAAVARKKADPEMLDIFKIGADGTGTRKARLPAKNLRFRFGVVDTNFWILERSSGFDRGGRSITIYQPTT